MMTLDEFLKQWGAQSMIAERMKVSKQVVSEWFKENNPKKPSVTSLIKLSKALKILHVKECTPSALLEWFKKRDEEQENL